MNILRPLNYCCYWLWTFLLFKWQMFTFDKDFVKWRKECGIIVPHCPFPTNCNKETSSHSRFLYKSFLIYNYCEKCLFCWWYITWNTPNTKSLLINNPHCMHESFTSSTKNCFILLNSSFNWLLCWKKPWRLFV